MPVFMSPSILCRARDLERDMSERIGEHMPHERKAVVRFA